MEPPSTCPFCNPGDAAFAESENFRALYNIAPILPGHSLVVPKRHVESLMALTETELTELMVFSRWISTILKRAFGASGFNWTIQEGPEAGQTVAHLHTHLIPRAAGDLPKPGDWYERMIETEGPRADSPSRPRITPAEMKEVVRRIRAVAAETDRK